MREFLYKVVAKIVKWAAPFTIVGKPVVGTRFRLYHEVSQHLGYLFQSKIHYEPEIQQGIRHLIRPGDTVFDVGSNIGQYALLFSEWVGPQGKVICFEPDFKTFSFLSFNRNINRIENIVCCHQGVGGTDGTMTFHRDVTTGGRRGSFVHDPKHHRQSDATDQLITERLDTIIEKFGMPQFVKIDVEGFEIEVLEGLTKELENCSFLIEVREASKEQIFNYFEGRGYKCTIVDSTSKEVSHFSQIPQFANLVFSK